MEVSSGHQSTIANEAASVPTLLWSTLSAADAGADGNSASGFAFTTSDGVEDNYTEDGDVWCEGYQTQDFRLRALWMYGGYPILALGTVGHALSLLLLALHTGVRALPLAVPLAAMSLSGLVALYVGLMPTIVEHQTCRRVVLKELTTETGCRLHVAAIYYAFQLYSLTESLVAVERLAAIAWPHRYRRLFTRGRNAAAVGGMAIALVGLNAVPYSLYGYVYDGFCHILDDEGNGRAAFRAWRYTHCVVYAVLPVAIMLPANCATLCLLRRSASSLQRSGATVAAVGRARPLTVTMLVLNGIFVVTTVPIMIGDWEQLADGSDVGGGDDGGGHMSPYEAAELAWAVCRLLMYLGISLTFVVYLAAATRFRRALRDLLVSGRERLEHALSAVSAGGGGSYRLTAAAAPLQPAALEQRRTLCSSIEHSVASTSDGKL